MRQRSWDILGIGNSAVDELIFVDQIPLPDSKMQVRDVQRQGGGLVATALVTAARQGVKTAFCSLIGTDELSRYSLEELAKEKVDCSPCVSSVDGVPYHAWILVDGERHTRTILYQRGIVEPPIESITEALIGHCNVLFIDHHAPIAGLKAAKIARRLGIPVVADLESDEVPDFEALLENIDHLVLSANFARHLTGRSAVEGAVHSLGNPQRACCVVTDGDRGCWYTEFGGQVIHYPAFRVPVMDTTGCGDVFHGAYAASLVRHEPVSLAIKMATASAAIKLGFPGGRMGIPNLERIRQFLMEHHENGTVG